MTTASQQWRLIPRIARSVVIGRGTRMIAPLLLFAVPAILIFVATFVVSGLGTNPEVTANHRMGSAQAIVSGLDAKVGVEEAEGSRRSGSEIADLTASLATPVEVESYLIGRANVYVGSLRRNVEVMTGNWSLPVFRSFDTLQRGSWPVKAGDAAISAALASRYKWVVGSTVRLESVHQPQRIVGIFLDQSRFAAERIILPRSIRLITTSLDANTVYQTNYLVSGSAATVEQLAREAIEVGVGVQTRKALVESADARIFRTNFMVVLIPGMVLVATLTSMATVVRVRRSSRQFAILLAIGVRGSTIVWSARAAALSASFWGATLGVVLASALSWTVASSIRGIAGHQLNADPASLSVACVTVFLVTAVAVLAAWIPARVARRGVASFDGRPPTPSAGAWPSIVGAAMLFGGALAGVRIGGAGSWLALGVAGVGGIVLVLALLRALSAAADRVGGHRTRIALRQLVRDRTRPVIAMAVALLAMGAASAELVYYDTKLAGAELSNVGTVHPGFAELPLRRVDSSAELTRSVVAAAGPDAKVAQISTLLAGPNPPQNLLSGLRWQAQDVSGSSASIDVVSDRAGFEAVAGRPPTAREWQAISAGTAVVLKDSVRAGGLTAVPQTLGGTSAAPVRAIPLAAIARDGSVDEAHIDAQVVVPQSFGLVNHIPTRIDAYFAWIPGRIDPGLGDRIGGVAEAHGIAADEVLFPVVALLPFPLDWRLVVLASCCLVVVGTSLAVLALSEDARPFFQSMFALGVSGRSQRAILARQALVLSLVGTALGFGLGICLGLRLARTEGVDFMLTIPYQRLTLLALLAAAASTVIAALKPPARSISELAA
ncbi:FtsX-like permease family protein [Frankineae bacterium MT45]|nr:FtsX-like permease family protein [Frankineae bacterium MT45]